MASLSDLYNNFSKEKLLEALKGQRDFSTVLEPDNQQGIGLSPGFPSSFPTPAINESPRQMASTTPDSFTPVENKELVEEQQMEEPITPPVKDVSAQQDEPSPTPGPTPKSDPNVLHFGSPSEDYRGSLQEAQKARDLNQLMATIGSAANQIGAGIAGGTSGRAVSVKPTGQEFYEGLQQRANQPITDLTQRMEMTKKSPEYATGLKDFLQQKFGLKIEGDPTEEQLKQILPTLSHLKGIEEQAKARKETAKQNAALKKEALDTKREDKLNKDVVDLQKALDPTQARSGEFAKQYASLVQGEKLKALTSKGVQGINLTPQEMEEFALGLGRLISGTGASSRAQIEALVPHSARGKAADIAQWVTNKPQGTQQQEFVKRMLQTVEREEEIAKRELERTIRKRHKAFAGKLGKERSEEYQQLLDESLGALGLGKETKRTPSSENEAAEVKPKEVRRMTKDGKIAIFDVETKQFLRYE